MKNRYLPLIFVLLAGIGTALMLIWNAGSGSAGAGAGTSPLDADYDYYIQDMLTTRFNSPGQAVSQLQAERVTHYPEGDRAVLQAPRYSALGASSGAWQVSAAAGTLTPEPDRADERLELQGEVILRKLLAAGDFVEVRTTALTLFTDAEEAATSEPVTLQTRDTRLASTGMRALLARDYIQLNHGRGTHDPTPRP